MSTTDSLAVDISPLIAAPSFDQEIIELQQLYARAEKHIKESEKHSQALSIPAVNQLRYAGHHLLRCLTAPSDALRKDELQKARNHCQRSIYDAIEILILDYLTNIKDFQKQFATIELAPSIPDYMEKRKTIREIWNFVETIENADLKTAYYHKCEAHLETLKPIWHSFEDAREELLKRQKKEKNDTYLKLFGLITATIGVIAALTKFVTD